MKAKDVYKEGDLVRLKSGGPVMTAEPEMRNDDNMLAVVWFDARGELHRDALRLEAVKAARFPIFK